MNVFVQGAEFGVVRFIGQTAFSEGVWLGIELRRPSKRVVISNASIIQAQNRLLYTFTLTLEPLNNGHTLYWDGSFCPL